jgi:hypothetical protein
MMKQYWRIGTIRALLGLAMGMFSLGRFYYVYIPWLQPLGLIGALVLGSILLLLFMGLGWAYDEKAKMWSQKIQVAAERDPYRYVPNYRAYAIDYPFFFAFITTLRGIFQKLELDTDTLDNNLEFLHKYYGWAPVKSDLVVTEPTAEEFLDSYPFSTTEYEPGRVSLGTRAKLGFEVQNIRINWIQALTGIFQDVLVFSAFYVALLYVNILVPGADPDALVPLEVFVPGIILISLPIILGIAGIGWYYDRKLMVWSADIPVKIERNPYTYVPEPRLYSIMYPIFHTHLLVLEEVMISRGIDETEIQDLREYLHSYYELDVANEEDMGKAKALRMKFETFGKQIQRRQID